MAHSGSLSGLVTRQPPGDHYLTLSQAQMKQLSEQKVMDGKVEGHHTRTELMRRKAVMRAAGVDPWDPPAVSSMPVIPMTVTPTHAPSLLPGDKNTIAAGHYSSVASKTLGSASVLARTTLHRPEIDHSRGGEFTKSFKTFLPKGC